MKSCARNLAMVTFMLASAAGAARNPTAELVARHMAARGGEARIHAIKAVDLRLDLVEPKFQLSANYLSNRSCMRIDVFAGDKYLQSEGVAASGGWEARAGDKGPTPQPPGGTETLVHGIDTPVRLISLGDFRKRGHKLQYRGRQLIDGTSYDVLAATYSDGYTAEFYLDRKTHLISRIREHKPMHLAVDPTKLNIETQFSDYRPVAGVMFPFFSREVNWTTGAELGHTTVKSIEVNTPAAIAVCTLPTFPHS